MLIKRSDRKHTNAPTRIENTTIDSELKTNNDKNHANSVEVPGRTVGNASEFRIVENAVIEPRVTMRPVKKPHVEKITHSTTRENDHRRYDQFVETVSRQTILKIGREIPGLKPKPSVNASQDTVALYFDGRAFPMRKVKKNRVAPVPKISCELNDESCRVD